MPLSSKQTLGDQLRTLKAGVTANHGAANPVIVEGRTYTPEELAAKVDAYLAAQAATVTAKNAYHIAVSNEKASNADARSFRLKVEAFVVAQRGQSDPSLRDYGFTPVGPRKTTAANQAIGVMAREATRKERGTMGKKAKAKIKGTIDPAIEQALKGEAEPPEGES
jgi:hypothetical protein